ncbi:MAG: hypothetical protein IKK38_06230, partial [Spirochaetaceae bacterium]|nr:hypothetical protein [Spirochaetaceae bacterium]
RLFLRKIAPAHATHLLACGYDNENSYTSQMPMRESANVNYYQQANGAKRRMVRTIKYFSENC